MIRILIAYATRAGSTRDVAGILADEFRTLGCDVEAVDLAKVKPSVTDFHMVVVGSGINAGAWFSEAVAWVRTHARELSAMPVAVFNVCLNAADDSDGKREETLAYNDPVAVTLSPVASESFAGRYAPERVGWFQRVLLRTMQKSEQDHVDPARIRAWAQELVASQVL